jgi:hypothetical protein
MVRSCIKPACSGDQFARYTNSVSSKYHCSTATLAGAGGSGPGGVTPPPTATGGPGGTAQSTSSTALAFHVGVPVFGGVLGAVVGVLMIAL